MEIYMVIYSNNINIGTTKVIIIGKGNYTGNKSVNFKIVKTSSNSKIATVNKNTGGVTIKGTGVATITAKAGKDSVKIIVKVSPKKQSLKSVKSVIGRKLTVKWAKHRVICYCFLKT